MTHTAFIVCALDSEAKPIIDIMGLRVCKDPGPMQRLRCYSRYFEKDNYKVVLCISGVGKVKASSALSLMLGSFNFSSADIVNVGVAGDASYNGSDNIGKIFCIDGIVDNDTFLSFYPEYYYNFKLAHRTLRTVSMPILGCEKRQIKPTDVDSSDDFLVDMEASALVEVARAYLSMHRVLILKVVSDALNSDIDAEYVKKLIGKHAQLIQTIIHTRALKFVKSISNKIELNEVMQKITSKLNITQYQKSDILRVLRGYQLRYGEVLSSEKVLDGINFTDLPNSKSKHKEAFALIMADLTKKVWST